MLPTPRTRRLVLDEEILQGLLQDWPLIQITGKAGIPPEIYRFTYCAGSMFPGRVRFWSATHTCLR